MSTDAVTPLRQRMIEDTNARKLGAHSQRSRARLAGSNSRAPRDRSDAGQRRKRGEHA